MITEDTVFILGAGASHPYGLPLGPELVNMIVEKLDAGLRDNEWLISQVLRAAKPCSPQMLESFRKDLEQSSLPSIDEFLQYRPELFDIGRCAIAATLLYRETQHGLRTCKPEEHWYQYLLLMLSAPFERFDQNRLTVITYNYDRSLEHFLFTSLRVREKDKADDEKWYLRLRQCVPIIHLHGDMGNCQGFAGITSPDYVCYGQHDDTFPESMQKAAGRIRIIHQPFDIDTDPRFHTAREAISKAKVICFLGFGYHQINLERLRLDKADGRTVIFGTAYGFTEAEKRQIVERTGGKLIMDHIGMPDQGCLRYIRESKYLQKIYSRYE